MQSDNPFKKSEDEYFVLRGKLELGRITREQFEAELRKLMVQDAQGRYWTLGVNDPRWFVYDGGQWIRSEPTPSAPSVIPQNVSAVATPPVPAPAPSDRKTDVRAQIEPLVAAFRSPSTAKGFSVMWIIVPTVIYALLSYNLLFTVIGALIGAGLRLAQGRPEIPSGVRPYLPLLQPVVLFLFLGANPFAVLPLGAAIVVGALQARRLIHALEPWWQIQRQLPSAGRRGLAVVLTLIIGYLFGSQASGNEWTYTFLSIVMATAVVFLLTFTPSGSAESPRSDSA